MYAPLPVCNRPTLFQYGSSKRFRSNGFYNLHVCSVSADTGTCTQSSIDEEKFVEAENKKKRKKKKEGDRREESEITSRLGDRTFLFLFLFFFRSMMLFTATTIEPVGNWSGRIEENFHDPRQPLQLDDVPFFFFYSFKSTWKTYNRRTYCIFQNQSEFGFSFAKCFAM